MAVVCVVVSSWLAWAERGPMNATDGFLGQPEKVAIVLRQSSPLFGSQEFYISGSGDIVIMAVRRDRSVDTIERKFKVKGAIREAAQVIERIRAENVLDMSVERNDEPYATCDDPPLLLVRNAKGQMRSLTLIGRAYSDLVHDIASLTRLTRDIEPVREGAYDPTDIPEDFAWAAHELSPAKQIRWTLMPTEQEIIEAEMDYQRKVQIQKEQIIKTKADEEKSKK